MSQRAATKRRGNGEGSIFQRGDGRWTAKITAGYDASGKRNRRVVYGKTKGEVQEKLTRLQNQKLDGTLTEAVRITVATYLDRWLVDASKPTVRPATFETYKGIVNKHIKPRIGGGALAKLTPLHVQGLYSALEAAGAQPRVRQHVHAVLHRAFKQAVKWGLVPRNVCEAVDPPRVPRKEIRPLTAAQAVAFLKAADGDRLHAMYVLALATGLRQGELFGLQWGDIDLEAATLSVRRTIANVSGKLIIGDPKSAKGRRKVELPATAVKALWSHKARMLAEGNVSAQWVFCDTNGGPLQRQNMQKRSFAPLLKLIREGDKATGRKGDPDFPTFRFHDLRHTAATLMLADGIHPKIVQERLGHSQIAMTLDIYSHVLPSMQKEAAASTERWLSAAGS